MSRKVRFVARLVVVIVLVSSLLLSKTTATANLHINSLIREVNKRGLVWYNSWKTNALSGERFVVFYPDGQRREARMVLDAAEGFYPELVRNFGLEIQGSIPVLLYAEQEKLNRKFGWPADSSTVGVYWAGSIRVLSPEVWIEPGEDYYRTFMDVGPMAHEIGHLFVDHLSRGNCPRWFNEGVVQYQEYLLSGFRFGGACSLPLERAYSFAELARFDALEDQHLAYHQSFSVMVFLVESYGWPAVIRVLEAFGRGAGLEGALELVLGIDLDTLDGEWRRWVACKQE